MNKDNKIIEIITREEAKERGLKRYFTGEPCVHGHISERDSREGKCTECISIQKRKYREKNKDSIKLKKREYHTKTKEHIDKKNKKYYEEHADEIKVKKKEMYKENKTFILEINKKYRQSERGLLSKRNSEYKRRTKTKQGDATTQQLLRLQKTQTHCYWCGTPLKNKVSHVDHYIPLSKGGKHTISNLVMACAKCNLSKGAKMPEEFAMQVGRLL